MAISVVMPALEMAQETGRLVLWRKHEGDAVVKGEVLFEVETDKAVMEIEAQSDGLLAGITVTEGEVVPVGVTIAWLVTAGEKPPLPQSQVASPVTEAGFSPVHLGTSPVTDESGSGIKASPKARRLAKEHGVNLTHVRGTGPDGTISAADIEAFTASHIATDRAIAEAMSPVARIMAERTTQSWTTTPHFYLVREMEATKLNVAREYYLSLLARDRNVRVTHTDLFIALVARVLVKHPSLNASWIDGEIRMNPQINIGIAMAMHDGVVTTVIPNAHNFPLAEIAARRHELSARARAARLRPVDIAEATFTISNLGMYGVDAFNAIITAPQAAILALGRISDRVVAINGQPLVRPMVTVTLSCDHRITDGARAAIFLQDLNEAVLHPFVCLQQDDETKLTGT